jgi:adenylate cyclase class 2
MAIEIELKVPVDDPEALKARLSSLGTVLGSYEKHDTYWIAADRKGAPGGIPASGIRIRRERAAGPDGRELEQALVTYKIRELSGGVEINDEREFTLGSGAGPGEAAAVFAELLERLGLRPDIRKEKQGRAWNLGGEPPVLAELSLIGGLGWFLELEILTEDRNEGTLSASRKRLLSLLEELEISPERIEARPYTQMLRELLPC